MRSTSRSIWLLGVLAVLLVAPSGASGQGRGPNEELRRNEEFQYRWQLSNLVGTLAGLFFPRQGEGSLSFRTDPSGRLRSELTITSGGAHQGEYFRYGSEMDTRTLQPIRAWSSYSWRGKTKSKDSPIDQEGVLDIASGIYAIRQNPPEKTRRMEIWSDGKIYPVVVIPLGAESRKLQDGKVVDVRHFSIRGVDAPGSPKWKGKLDLWLAQDAEATPVEIVISRNLADVRMKLTSLQ